LLCGCGGQEHARGEAENAVVRLLLQDEVPGPTEMLVREARSLRKVANEKLKLAIAAMKPTA
jgi:hypothetical protein